MRVNIYLRLISSIPSSCKYMWILWRMRSRSTSYIVLWSTCAKNIDQRQKMKSKASYPYGWRQKLQFLRANSKGREKRGNVWTPNRNTINPSHYSLATKTRKLVGLEAEWGNYFYYQEQNTNKTTGVLRITLVTQIDTLRSKQDYLSKFYKAFNNKIRELLIPDGKCLIWCRWWPSTRIQWSKEINQYNEGWSSICIILHIQIQIKIVKENKS